MATLTQTYKAHHVRLSASTVDQAIEKLVPRRCIVISTGLIVIGLSIPILMTLGLLPANLLVAATGVALVALGGVLALTLCGEI